MKKRMLSLFLAVTMVLQLCGTMAFAAEADGVYASGEAGMLSWVVTDDGTLTISGYGGMDIYAEDEWMYSTAPWGWCASVVEQIIIEEGVMSISPYAFAGFDKLRYAFIADTVQMVDSYAFHRQSGEVPTTILFEGEAPYISSMAFAERYNTYGVYIEGKSGWAEEIGDYYANINWLSMDEHGIIETGTCGENHTWKIGFDGTMTVSGSGVLEGGFWTIAPYTKLVIEEGTTAIGAYAFCMLGNLTSVDIPKSVTSIGERAFDECYNIAEITFRGDAPAMNEFAFNYAGYYNGTTAFYPKGNPTWTADTLQNYGGDLTWTPVEMGGSEDGGEDNPGGDIGTEEGGSDTPETPAEITWSLSDDGTILTIDGTGPMPDYEYIEIDYWGQYTTPWYEYAANINEVIIGDGITRIGANAFGEMWSLTKLTIGASVTELAEGVFQSCYALGELALSADNTHFCLQDGILFNAEQTELLFYPSSLETAFYAVPETVKKIAPYAFYCASYNLAAVGFPDGLTEIGDHAFYYKSLTAITLPDSIITIGDYAFYGNSADSLTIPDSVTSIGEYAFGSIFGLTDVYIGSGLQEMGECVFGDCSDLANITVDAGNSAFCAEENVLFTKNRDTLLLYPSGKTGTSYTVPDTVRTIAVRAFCSNSGLTEVILPDGLERIEENAFFYARNLAKADLPDSVTHLGDYAFGNTALTAVTIPDGVETIGASAFAYAPVTTVTIGSGVTTIEERAFSGCGKLTEVTFRGNAPTSVGQLAFSSVRATAYYPAGNGTWPAFIESYSDYDTHLTWTPADMGGTDPEPPMAGSCGDDLTWRMDGGTLIISGSGAMYDYQGTGTPWDKTIVQEVVFDENCTITYIGTAAFADCTGLTAIDIPDTVEVIATEAFRGCSNLASVTLPKELTIIGGIAFAYCTNLTEITVPAKVTSISNMAFGLSGLETITMEGSEPALGSFVFQGCTLTTYAPWVSWSSNQWGNVIYNGIIPDTTPPVLTIEGPAEGSRVWKNVELTLTVQDADPDTAVTAGYAIDGQELGADRIEDGVYPAKLKFSLRSLSAADDGKTLTITVTAQDAAGNTAAETLSYVIDNVPAAVTGLTAAAGEEGIALAWKRSDPEDNVSGYRLVRIGSDGSTVQIDLPLSTTSYPDTDVANGVTYTYKIVACGVSGMDAESSAVQATYTKDETAPVLREVWPTTADKVTLCHNGRLQMVASDETALSHAEVFADGIKIGQASFNAEGIASIDWDCSEYAGQVQLTYIVYDEAGNSAECTETVTVRPYTRPVTPTGLTAEGGFRSGVLTWTYDGDLQTLKQFHIYDADSGMLAATVRGYTYTFRGMEESCSYQVAAVDIYGAQSFSTEPVTLTPELTESVPPRAVLAAQELTAVTGTPITLTGSNSTDNDVIASYTWDFGDGTTAEGIHATHTYTAGGTYTVILTVTDRSGNSDTVRAEITVLDTLSEDATHTRLTVTVRNSYAAGTPGIAGATVTVFSDGYEGAARTDSRGTATLVVPKGQHTLTAVKDGFDGKMQEISIGTNIGGESELTIHLAPSGVDVVGGDLKVESMTREEIEEAGIDMNDPANNHVVKQSTTVRFQPTPELAFDLPIEQILNAAGDLLRGTGFGWHSFTPDPPKPDDPDPDEPEEDEDDDKIIIGMQDPIPPKYDVGVFPVGDSAFMVIYGQTHWLKEMFNVELIVFNNSYVDDLQDVSAQLQLPKGLSLAAMLEGDQTEKVDLGTIERKGTAEDTSVRQVNWYVRGDAEGEYNLTALVNGYVGGTPFEKTFTAEEAIKVYAGSALKLTVTLPRSAYAEKEYAVKFSLTNVSDKPIYNLSFGLDSARQFVADLMSDGSTGEVEREFTSEDFKNNMTYGLPALEPGKAFNLVLRTTFAYEHQFVEWAMGKVPGTEVGYRVADVFVTTLEGSTTEIPVEIVLEDVQKDSLFQWVWDETIGALKEKGKEAVIEFIDDKVFEGFPVAEKSVEYFEIITGVKDHFEETEIAYTPTVTVTEGVLCVPKDDVSDWLRAFDTYGLRRGTMPGVLVWSDAEVEISADGRTMAMPEGGGLYVLRLGETETTPQIDVTTYYVDGSGAVQAHTQTLTTDAAYTPGLQPAAHLLMDALAEDHYEIPMGEDPVLVPMSGLRVGENGSLLMRASNEVWTVVDSEGREAPGMTVAGGTLVIDRTAKAGSYTVQLRLEGTAEVWQQKIVLLAPPPCSFGDLQILSKDGAALEAIPEDLFWVSVPVSKLAEAADPAVFVAAYTAEGQMVEMALARWDTAVGETRACSLQLDNRSGRIAEIRAFALAPDQTPMATPVSYK